MSTGRYNISERKSWEPSTQDRGRRRRIFLDKSVHIIHNNRTKCPHDREYDYYYDHYTYSSVVSNDRGYRYIGILYYIWPASRRPAVKWIPIRSSSQLLIFFSLDNWFWLLWCYSLRTNKRCPPHHTPCLAHLFLVSSCNVPNLLIISHLNRRRRVSEWLRSVRWYSFPIQTRLIMYSEFFSEHNFQIEAWFE